MKESIKTVYKCDHCGKNLLVKKAMEEHEVMCWGNPENKRACIGCDYLGKADKTLYFDTPIGEQEKVVSILYCSKLEIFLHTPKNEYKGNALDLGDDTNHPMPRECNSFKPQGY